MNINFKQPKYMLPLILSPFLYLGYYVYATNFKKEPEKKQEVAGIQTNTGEVSDQVKKSTISNKLDAYRKDYKEGNGISAMSTIQEEKTSSGKYIDSTSAISIAQKKIDSVKNLSSKRFANTSVRKSIKVAQTSSVTESDQLLSKALSKLAASKKRNEQAIAISQQEPRTPDPMETFKKQMAYLDSIKAANDPDFKAKQEKRLAAERAANAIKEQRTLSVVKANKPSPVFNTITVKKETGFIKAIIDENVTGYAGSRIRIRLLEDIKAGNNFIPKGTYIFAEINGFTDQRVNLGISSILTNDKILPVKLLIYDVDGLPGLYVPASAFRQFSKELGTNTVQGVTVDNTSQSFTMSMLDKVFTSTSSAVASLIRKNKAKIKYDTFVYLIDPTELKNEQKNY